MQATGDGKDVFVYAAWLAYDAVYGVYGNLCIDEQRQRLVFRRMCDHYHAMLVTVMHLQASALDFILPACYIYTHYRRRQIERNELDAERVRLLCPVHGDQLFLWTVSYDPFVIQMSPTPFVSLVNDKRVVMTADFFASQEAFATPAGMSTLPCTCGMHAGGAPSNFGSNAPHQLFVVAFSTACVLYHEETSIFSISYIDEYDREQKEKRAFLNAHVSEAQKKDAKRRMTFNLVDIFCRQRPVPFLAVGNKRIRATRAVAPTSDGIVPVWFMEAIEWSPMTVIAEGDLLGAQKRFNDEIESFLDYVEKEKSVHRHVPSGCGTSLFDNYFAGTDSVDATNVVSASRNAMYAEKLTVPLRVACDMQERALQRCRRPRNFGSELFVPSVPLSWEQIEALRLKRHGK